MSSTLPHITVRDAFGNEREIEISRTPFTLGRQGDNDLVLLDTRISRRHARIVKDGEGYWLEDTGSRHGTFVNGERVTASRHLNSGDQISLGVTDSYALAFGMEEPVLPSLLEKFEKVSDQSRAPQLHHLGLLLQMAQMMLRAPALEEVLTTLLDSAVQLTNAERGLLFLKEGEGALELRLARGKGGISLSPEVSDYSRTVVKRVSASGQEEVILEDEASGRTEMETGIIRTGTRGIVAVPLQKLHMADAGGETFVGKVPEMLGLLYLDTRSQAAAVTGLDRQVLQTLAVEGSTVIENARLFRLARDQERTQHEMFLARNIQQGLLPRELPQSDYFQVLSVTTPTEAVGGDYYDVVDLPDGFRRRGNAENLEVIALGQFARQQSLLDVSRQKHFVLDALLVARQAKQAGVLNHRGAFHRQRLEHLPVKSRDGGGLRAGVKIEQAEQLRRLSHKGLSRRIRHVQLLQGDSHDASRAGADDAGFHRRAAGGLIFQESLPPDRRPPRASPRCGSNRSPPGSGRCPLCRAPGEAPARLLLLSGTAARAQRW